MTTTEVATIDDSEFISTALTTVDPFDTLNRYADMLAKALKFAQDVCRTSLVPKVYQGKPGDAAVAILHGTELGLHPLQALQNIFPVHGMPSIYAKTMVALLKAKGYKFKTVETGPERVTLTGWWPGEDPETSTWTIERATKAGFVPTIDPETGKYKTKKFDGPNGKYEKLIGNEKYLLQPEEMLWAKAATTVCKRLAPHILLGLAVAEDQEDRVDDPEPVRVTSERVTSVEIAPAGTSAAGPVVQQWQPPAESSTSVVSDAAPENPESNSSAASDEVEKADTPAIPVEPPADPGDGAPTEEQVKALGDALRAEGLRTRKAQLGYLSEQFKREITTPTDLTAFEAQQITDYLVTAQQAQNAPADADQQVAEQTATEGTDAQ